MTDGQSIKDGLAAVQAKYGNTFSNVKGTPTEIVIGTQHDPEAGAPIEIDEALARYDKKHKK